MHRQAKDAFELLADRHHLANAPEPEQPSAAVNNGTRNSVALDLEQRASEPV